MYILCKEYIFYRYSIYNKMQSTITGILCVCVYGKKKGVKKKLYKKNCGYAIFDDDDDENLEISNIIIM